jgi:hypothetical protein
MVTCEQPVGGGSRICLMNWEEDVFITTIVALPDEVEHVTFAPLNLPSHAP